MASEDEEDAEVEDDELIATAPLLLPGTTGGGRSRRSTCESRPSHSTMACA
jgi:hypothetical protein